MTVLTDTAAPQSLTGQTLGGRFLVGDEVGRGASGVVYRGLDRKTGAAVAIKFLAHDVNEPSNLTWVKRFRREAKTQASIRHPNSVRLIDSGYTGEGEGYLIMELLEGRELSDELKACIRLPLDSACTIAQQVLAGLHQAHRVGVVHRDLKPSNIFLCAGDTIHAKVLDYGLAKVERTNVLESLTKAGTVVGTPAYMAPEQILGKTVTPATDLYAVGAVFYEMLVGKTPFTGRQPMDLLVQHLRVAVPSLAAARPDLSCAGEAQRLIEALMAKDPAQRPASATAAAGLFADLLANAQRAAVATDSTALGVIAMPHDDAALGASVAQALAPAWAVPAIVDEAIALGVPAIVDEATALGVPAMSDDATALGVPAMNMARPPRPVAAAPAPATTPRPDVASRRMPRRAVPLVDTRVLIDLEVALAGAGALTANVVVAVIVPGRREPYVLTLRHEQDTWKGRLALDRPTSDGLEVRVRVQAEPGTQWHLRAWSSKPSGHQVCDQKGQTEGASAAFSSRLGP